MRALAPGKVNLALFLGEVRDDGRHELVTLFESVSLADEMSMALAEGDEVVCPGVEAPNLVQTALAELRRRGWEAPPVRVEIHKRIPVAGGMGGGSADAACFLRMAAQLAPLPAALDVHELASQLGADVPSQLEPGLVLGMGAGDEVAAFAPIEPHAFVVLPGDFALSTAEVYAEADRLGLPRAASELREDLKELERALGAGTRLPAWLVVNDLEPAAISLAPQIERALAAVSEVGADRAFVSGSGPTVAGLWWGSAALERAEAGASELARQFPGATAHVPVPASYGLPQEA